MISQCDSTAPHGSHFRTSGDKVTLPPAPLHSHSTWKPLVASKDKRSSQIRKIRLISHKSSAKLLVPINNQPKRKSYAQVCLNGCHRSRWSVHAVRRMVAIFARAVTKSPYHLLSSPRTARGSHSWQVKTKSPHMLPEQCLFMSNGAAHGSFFFGDSREYSRGSLLSWPYRGIASFGEILLED